MGFRGRFFRNKDSCNSAFTYLGKILKESSKTAILGCLSPPLGGDRRRWVSAFARYALTLLCYSRDRIEQLDAPTALQFHHCYQERLSPLQSERARDLSNFPCQEALTIWYNNTDASQLRTKRHDAASIDRCSLCERYRGQPTSSQTSHLHVLRLRRSSGDVEKGRVISLHDLSVYPDSDDDRENDQE